MTKLKHMTIDSIQEADPRVELAKRAETLLGYKKLAQAVTQGTLLHTLMKLEILPLVTSHVTEYKNKKTKPGMWSNHRNGYRLLTAAAACLGLARYYGHYFDFNQTTFPNVATIVLLGVGILLIVFGIIERFDGSSGERDTFAWGLTPISEYSGTIPEFILNKAVQIKTELPAARLYVEHLYREREMHVTPDRDPFLVVSLEAETYYIDVWDEKEYESKL